MRKRGTIVIAGLVVIAVAIGAATLLQREEATTAGQPAGAAALTATIDPATGEAVVSSGGEDATSMSDEGLVEEPSHLPDGGTYVDLQGRFRNSATASADDSGSIVVECSPDSSRDGGGQ